MEMKSGCLSVNSQCARLSFATVSPASATRVLAQRVHSPPPPPRESPPGGSLSLETHNGPVNERRGTQHTHGRQTDSFPDRKRTARNQAGAFARFRRCLYVL